MAHVGLKENLPSPKVLINLLCTYHFKRWVVKTTQFLDALVLYHDLKVVNKISCVDSHSVS